jgi:carboxypeptidase Q
MHRCRAAIVLGLLFAIASFAETPNPAPAVSDADAKSLDKKIMVEIKTKPEIIPNLAYLSDIIGPRLTGSAALKKANDWTAEKMKSYGLENVHLEPYEIPVGWERGTISAKIIEPEGGRPLLMASAGWSPGTKGKVEGDVVIFKATKREELAQYKGKLKNALILRREPSYVAPIVAVGTPAGDRPMGGGPMGGGPMGGGRRGGGFDPQNPFVQELRDFFKAEGVAAMLQDSAKPQGLLVTTGSWRGRERAAEQEAIPTLYVAHEHYALLYRLASRPAPAKTRVELEVTNKFIPGPITVYNTVGEIKGSEKPDEFVVVGAHLDSWDLAQGTTDNGTGSCITLETARVLAKCGVKPKRTIRFVLFTGEEQGLHGSRAYVERHKDEMPKVSMALVHDTGTAIVHGIGLQGRDVLKPIFEKELEALKEVGLKDISVRSMQGTDHQSFERVGVPGFACQQDMTDYRLTHHTQTDTLDKANEANLVQGAQVMAVAAMRVANLPTLLPREKKAPAPRTEEKKPEEKKPDEKKPEEKKPVEKKPNS